MVKKGIEINNHLQGQRNYVQDETYEKVIFMREAITEGIQKQSLRDEALGFLKEFAKQHALEI